MLMNLFWTFFKIGFMSFGGGYAMLPVVGQAVMDNNWMSPQQYTEAIALAGMAPGPVAMNAAVYVGYSTAGLPGSLVASLGMVLPSAIIIFLVATVFYRMYDNHWVQATLNGMKPAVIALIAYAAYTMTINSNIKAAATVSTFASVAIFIAALAAMIKFRVHPLAIILGSGIVGIWIYA
ncbi:chromate transporter [Paenibacillus pasadenensis]|uniref:chromate transporter n=1 Tax=Paenibacillus pasadenensis TaxID=217090 RepID=UPI00203D3ADE|nr:chromate transporter [Paenibacillus pasadenensis]MCM3746209.1 chromate transporter [Paenibacillus pasadenensis]